MSTHALLEPGDTDSASEWDVASNCSDAWSIGSVPEEAYQPRPFNSPTQIRLLRFLPTWPGSEHTECELELFELDSLPRYQALSYHWGPVYDDGSHLTHKILCDGYSVKVTSVLHHALQRIREELGECLRTKLSAGTSHQPCSYIWVDALCIDQQNAFERSSQVMLMKHIYERAASAILWEPWPEDALSWSKRNALTPASFANGMSRDPPDRTTCMQWFSRRWVVQETMLQSRRFFLGPTMCFELPEDQVQQWWPFLTTPRSLLGNLVHFAFADCLDARDRVYSLLSISNDTKTFLVDYSKKTHEVYNDVAMRYIQHEQLPLLLACGAATTVAAATKEGHLRPSWIPDWSHSSFRKVLLGREDQPLTSDAADLLRLEQHKAGEGIRAVCMHTDHVLVLRGASIIRVGMLIDRTALAEVAFRGAASKPVSLRKMNVVPGGRSPTESVQLALFGNPFRRDVVHSYEPEQQMLTLQAWPTDCAPISTEYRKSAASRWTHDLTNRVLIFFKKSRLLLTAEVDRPNEDGIRARLVGFELINFPFEPHQPLGLSFTLDFSFREVPLGPWLQPEKTDVYLV